MPEIIVKLGDRVVQKYLLYKNQKLSIGRAPDNDIAIENPAVSRRHATIEMVNGRYILEDNNSANGSYVNGVRVTKTEVLDKDVLTIGKHKLHFYNQDAAPSTVVAQPVLDDATMLVGDSPKGPDATLVGTGKQSGQNYTLAKVETRIGRAADNDIRLQDWFVSKHHAVIGRKGSVYVLRDLDSWRHTMVNGQIITETTLKNGDEVKFGPNIEMRFDIMEGAAVGELAARKPVELGDPPPEDSPMIEDLDAVEVQSADASASDDQVAAEAAAAMPTQSTRGAEEPQAEAPPIEEPAAAVESGEAHGEAPAPEHAESGRSRKRKKRRHQEAEAAPAPEPTPEAEPAVASSDNGQEAAAGGGADLSHLSDAQREEVVMWEKALANSSNVIRKQAAKKLKQLTGRDYDIQ